ncbi:hypothetical protein EVAR_23264_1 [Eumeta japonica]|uniref:Uncharacterized protein n=1 Tax=Eumeta variegata TaxID=151549 RepID=A0A4C1V524_EUMVA|nr:hypothetical protein EVAR_23264_1 [Eumeta japonica]
MTIVNDGLVLFVRAIVRKYCIETLKIDMGNHSKKNEKRERLHPKRTHKNNERKRRKTYGKIQDLESAEKVAKREQDAAIAEGRISKRVYLSLMYMPMPVGRHGLTAITIEHCPAPLQLWVADLLTSDKEKIQQSTSNQRNSNDWIELRKNMITASNFGTVDLALRSPRYDTDSELTTRRTCDRAGCEGAPAIQPLTTPGFKFVKERLNSRWFSDSRIDLSFTQFGCGRRLN